MGVCSSRRGRDLCHLWQDLHRDLKGASAPHRERHSRGSRQGVGGSTREPLRHEGAGSLQAQGAQRRRRHRGGHRQEEGAAGLAPHASGAQTKTQVTTTSAPARRAAQHPTSDTRGVLYIRTLANAPILG